MRPRGRRSVQRAIGARSEAEVLRESLKYLKAAGIFAIRLNTGAMEKDGRFIRFGTVGCADVLAFLRRQEEGPCGSEVTAIYPVWLEMKSPVGKQSIKQKLFQGIVETESHRYFVIRSVAELIAALAEI
jgi:hypothetical protein